MALPGFRILFFIRYVIVIPFQISCSPVESEWGQHNDYQFKIRTENKTLHYLEIITDTSVNQWKLPYPVYRFQIGDVDGNGFDDMLVGVIKTTRFDTTFAKRLFIFKNYNGLVRPLWLGSRLGQPLEDFICIQTKCGTRIVTIEKEKSKKYLVAEYKWRRFGLEFTKYIEREIDLFQAQQILNNNFNHIQ